MPDVNEKVCGGRAAPGECNDLCGGAGCGFCGGPACQDGAKTKAEIARNISVEAGALLEKKQLEAELLKKNVSPVF